MAKLVGMFLTTLQQKNIERKIKIHQDMFLSMKENVEI
jgi:hypothetical protein